MKRVRRFGSIAAIVGLFVMSGSLGTARVQAAPKKGGTDGHTATCDYLRNIITYPYTSPVVKAWAMSLYTANGCQPALP